MSPRAPAITVVGVFMIGCGTSGGTTTPDTAVAPDAQTGRAIIEGERVGPIGLGQTWAQVRATLGEPLSEPVVLTRIGFVTWPSLGLEALFTSTAEQTLSDDAIVIGAAATTPADFVGAARPGLGRGAIEAALGIAPDEYGGHAYYPVGLAIEYADDVATKVAVIAPFELVPEPPPMAPAQSTIPGDPP